MQAEPTAQAHKPDQVAPLVGRTVEIKRADCGRVPGPWDAGRNGADAKLARAQQQ